MMGLMVTITNGVPEELITGDADDYEKFLAWAETIEKAVGNPVYEWTHWN
nr:glucuronate isomerase [Limosilactobacillus balticus]